MFLYKMDGDQEEGTGTFIPQEIMDFAEITKTIFAQCNKENADSVQAEKLVEFIRPYLLEDLSALENLKTSLDPEGRNVPVTGEKFYEIMSEWSQRLSTPFITADSNYTKSEMEENDMPYTHSTPRPSFGDKLLKCKDLLNLSNVSGYSLSSSRLELPDTDKTALEEEIKKLEHQLSKTANELELVRQQLTLCEDQNEQLQLDLDRVNKRLHTEQQLNEHLQKDIKFVEESRDELNLQKKGLDEIKRKMTLTEKECLHFKKIAEEAEIERAKLEKKMETLIRQQREYLKELFDLKTELEVKEEQLSVVNVKYDELKLKLSTQKDLLDQLREENELLTHQKATLERRIKWKPSKSSPLGNALLSHQKHVSHTPTLPVSPQHESFQHVYTRNCSTPKNGSLDSNRKEGSSDEDIDWKKESSKSDSSRNGDCLQKELDKLKPFDLEGKIQKLQTYINELEVNNQQLSLELSNKDKTYSDKAELNQMIIKTLKHRILQLELCEKATAKRSETQSDLNEEIATLQNEIRTLTMAKSELEGEIARSRIEHTDNVEEVIRSIEEHINSKNLIIADLRNLNRILRENLGSVEISLRQNEDCIEKLKREFANDLELRSELSGQLATLKEDLQAKLGKIDELRTNYRLLTETHMELSSKYEEEVLKTAELTKSVDEFKKSLLDKEELFKSEISLLKAESETRHEALLAKLAKEVDKNRTLESQLKDAKEIELNVTNDTNKKSQMETDKWKIDINKLEEHVTIVNQSNAALHINLYEKEVELSNVRVSNEKLKQELDCVKNKKQTLKQKVATLKNVNVQLVSLQQSYSKELESLTQSYERALFESAKGKDSYRQKCEEMSIKCSILQRRLDEQTLELERSALRKGREKSYSKQEIVIEKLKEKIEILQRELIEKKLCNCSVNQSQLTNCFNKIEFGTKFFEKRCEMCISSIKREKLDAGVQVDSREITEKLIESKTVGRFTLISSSQSPDSPSQNVESTDLTQYAANFTKLLHKQQPQSEGILEVPTLDLDSFVNKLIEDLEMDDFGLNGEPSQEAVKQKIDNITSQFIATSTEVADKIETQTEEYRQQYEGLLTLITDISQRLRDHVCIGTPEPIVPVYVLLEELRLQLRALVQNVGQIGVLICEERTRRFLELFLKALQREKEVEQNGPPKTDSEPPRKNNKLGRCGKLSFVFLLLTTAAVAFLFNLTCQWTDSQYCPWDGLIRRITLGDPPM